MTAVQVFDNDSEIVERDVRKMRAAGTIANRPDIGSRRLEFLVHFHMATVRGLHSRLFETDAARIWCAPTGDQQIRSFQEKVTSAACAEKPDRLA